MTDSNQSVIILGAGQAGGQCAASLRRFGWKGRIVLAGSEPHPPYQRPPLSKTYLAGEIDETRLWLQSRETWADQKVELRLGVTAIKISRAARTVTFDDGSTEHYDRLVLATGAMPRTLLLQRHDRVKGVRYLRTIADVDALKGDFQPGRRIVIIGGGYIGLEAASVARKLGAEPVVLEREDRLLARVAVPELSQFYLEAHRARGVEVELNVQLGEFVGRGGLPFGRKPVKGVRLIGGRVIAGDSVLVGIGVLPNQGLAATAGLETGNGVVVDSECRTPDPNIFAIGDCAQQSNWLTGERVRLESVPNALEHAKHAAAAICGAPPPKPEVPWFWSDQFDLKLQTAGLIGRQDTTILRGSMEAEHFTLFHLREGVLIAADSICDGHGFMAAKAMIAARATPDPAALADAGVPIKETMKAALSAGSVAD